MSNTYAARTLGCTALALTLATLAGCGAAEEARKQLDAIAAARAGSFETATRTPAEDPDGGQRFVLSAVARREAHWYEAMSAMSRDLGSYCADGVPFSLHRMAPAHNPMANKPGEYTWHPAGTVFEQEITCSQPFAGQRMVAAETDDMAALAALKSELLAGGTYDRDRHMHTATSFNEKQTKYSAVTETIGSMVMGVSRRCRGGGVHIQNILVHSNPTPDPSQSPAWRNARAYVGVDAVCADGLAADPRP